MMKSLLPGHLKSSLILILQVTAFNAASAQEHLFSVQSSIVADKVFAAYDDPFITVEEYTFGLSYQYVPRHAKFCVSGGLQYFSYENSFMLPLTLDVRIGNRLKILFGAGGVPLIRIAPAYQNKSLALGWILKGGLELTITKMISVFSEFGYLYFRQHLTRYSHFGDSYNEKRWESMQFIGLGLRWVLQDPDKN